MQTMTYKGVKVQYDDSISEEEARELTRDEKRDWWENLNKIALGYLTITRDGNEIVLHGKEADPIQKIRRITGYLVGTTNKWNNGKLAELEDRVKHA
jgi:anaerobic ribonucleoside-triphosphate reductase